VGGNLTLPAGTGYITGATTSDNIAITNVAGGNLNQIGLLATTTYANANFTAYGNLVCWGTASKPGGGVWADTSDSRLKHHVEGYAGGLAEIRRLRPVTFRHNGKGGTRDDGRIFTGLVANEALEVMPELVGTMRARLDPADEDEVDLLTLDATPLIYALVNAVNELTARVAVLESAP
jgi:Chaperone of endosialidase